MFPFQEEVEELVKMISVCNIIYKEFVEEKNLNDELFFLEEAEQKIFDTKSEKLIFCEIVFYSYQIIYERSGNNIKFLHEIAQALGYEVKSQLKTKTDIQNLRTYLGHFLQKGKSHDEEILKQCKLWFMASCNENKPKSDLHWRFCVASLIGQMISYIKHIEDVLSELQTKFEEEIIWIQWNDMQMKYIPQYKKEEVLEEIKIIYHMEINNKKFLNQYNRRIDDNIEVYGDKENLFACIEEIVLREVRLPVITGKEVREKYGFEKKELEIIMKSVMEEQNKNPRLTKDEALSIIENMISKQNIF